MKTKYYLLSLLSAAVAQSVFASPEGEANFQVAASYFLDVLNNRQTDLVDDLFAEDFLFIGNSGSSRRGTAVVQGFIQWFQSEEAKIEILEHIANEGWVYVMFRMSYRWPDNAAAVESERTNTLIRHARFKINDGKIVEFRLIDSNFDHLKELSGFEGSFEDMVEALLSLKKRSNHPPQPTSASAPR